MTHALELYRHDTMSRAREWSSLNPEERKRRAATAARDKDAGELWSLTEAYLTLYGRKGAGSDRTRKAYREGVQAFVTFAGENAVSLLRARREDGAGYVRSLEALGRKPATVRLRLAAVRALYGALNWTETCEVDPFKDVRATPDQVAPWDKRQPYREEEVSTLLEAADERMRALVLLCAHGGLRISEALALRWADVDLIGQTMTVQHGKGGKLRRVALSRSLTTSLRVLLLLHGGGNDDEVIGGGYDSAVERLQWLCKRAGVTYRGFHAFRHYAGTRLVGMTGNLEHAARHLGHASIETTRVYAKWSDTALRDALSDW